MQELAPHIKRWRKNLSNYGKNCVKIVDKNGKEKPFELNKAQQYIDDRIEAQKAKKGYVRCIILKGRQQGASKYNCLRQLRNTTLHTNVNAFVMAHDASTTSSLFDDYKALYNSVPNIAVIKPDTEKSNAKELVFSDIGSKIKVGTAGSAEVGRGTTIHRFHGSECAFWSNGDKLLAGVMQAVPLSPNTEVILESTANGVGNKFFTMCMQAMKGEGDYELIFVPWWWSEEYQTDDEDYTPSDADWEYYDTYMSKDCQDEEQGIRKLAWRNVKIHELGDKKFKQEYPANPVEAFQMSGDSLFKPEWVKCARDTELREDMTLPLVVGVDAAEAGGDRTVITFRRGKKILPEIQIYDEMDQMRLAGIVAQIINIRKPARVFFDKAYAQGCVARLKELGYAGIVRAIAFGSKPIEPERFINKRAEMHWMLKEWLEEGYVDYDSETGAGGVDIPDRDDLNADLACIPEPPPTSNGKIKMVEKQKIKEEYGMSPDITDSVILTFAEPLLRNADNVNMKVKTKSATGNIFGK